MLSSIRIIKSILLVIILIGLNNESKALEIGTVVLTKHAVINKYASLRTKILCEKIQNKRIKPKTDQQVQICEKSSSLNIASTSSLKKKQVKRISAPLLGNALTISSIDSLTLINADTDKPVAGFEPILDGSILNIATFNQLATKSRSFNIRANLGSGSIGSVRFGLNDVPNFRTENSAPFTLAGDYNGNYFGWVPKIGANLLTVTPYSEKDGKGTKGKSYTLTLNFINKSVFVVPSPTSTLFPTTKPTLLPTSIPEPTFTALPNPTSTPSPVPTNTLVPTNTSIPVSTPMSTPTNVTPPTSTPNKPQRGALPPLAELTTWENNMLKFGTKHCNNLKNNVGSAGERLNSIYYDAEWVYFRIADYTKDASWNSCAQVAESVYRDGYVIPNSGHVPGYWNFTHGVTQDYLRTGDETSKSTAILLSKNAAFNSDQTSLASTVNFELSREVAYAILAYINTEDLGEPRRARLAPLVDQAIGHINQWFVAKSATYIKSFMVGLTAHALISYYERTSDPRILSAVQTAMDGLWDLAWVESAQSFVYQTATTATGSPSPSPDLNLIIVPAFGWLYHMTGDIKYIERGDKIFAGGVKGAWLENAKQFNQSYRISFDYLKYRDEEPLN